MLFILTLLHFLFIVIEMLVVTAMVAVGIVLAFDLWAGDRYENKADQREKAALRKERIRDQLDKENIRRQKEADAYEGFFEESYVPGFNANGSLHRHRKFIPTAKAMAYYKQMDELQNEQQSDNVEDILRDLTNPKDRE